MKTEIDNEMEARDMSETPLEPPEETPHAPAGTVQRRSQWGEVWRRLKKNRTALAGLAVIILIVITALLADVIAPYHYRTQNLQRIAESPSRAHLLGTDELGRDVLSRIIYGTRVSLQVGFVAVSISVIVGGLLGAVAGYYGKVLDNAIMRVMDVLLAIPSILLAIAIVSAFGGGLVNVMIAVGISTIPVYARIVKASVMSIVEQEFIEAARAIGARDIRIIFKHVLPNCLAPIIVQGTLGVATAILSAAGLSFIGLGIQPPTPEWGAMLSGGRHLIRQAPHVATFPGVAIMITIFALNLLGDGLRDALDPRLKT
ncbi:ABC transporter permease [Spirochaeta africana]|uniref:ABC-type dipeptide/oligopeptide/nickel transport system, permease component n=1 Tax=Spirochaeta africana (strain ATCC 700263 / DSM 8902 / Z-7692) TaxID=889378 RepID=H9UGF8_SPIAZ|nr:ABC transporter permease [Spirochaeta africana]AFG36601.1 ABC-type dipeptide/oligopeptide/nickel transport system, permease component [Spirochaeta africana DSM 8902]